MPRLPLLTGSRVVVVNAPDDAVVVRPPPPVEPIADIAAAVVDALRFPLAGAPLEEAVPRNGRATIVVEPPALPLPGAPRDPRQAATAAAVGELESLGIPTELDEAAALAVGGSLRRLDLIDVVRGGISYYAVEGVSVGVHAVARAQYRSPNSTDALAALKAAAKAARHFTGTTITAAFAGERLRVRVAQLFVANLPLFAFGLEVAPEASPDDGRLELVVNRWSGRTALIPLLVYLRRGTHLESTKTNSWSVERVTIDPGVSPIVADSTNLGRGPVEVSVKPGALNLVAP